MKLKAEIMRQLAKVRKTKVVFKEKRLVPDGEGGFTEGWVGVATVWAKSTPIQARQQYEFNSVGVEATHRLEIVYPGEVKEEWQAFFGDKGHEIKTVEKYEQEQVITCRELR